MIRILILALIATMCFAGCSTPDSKTLLPKEFSMTREHLLGKIKGGWAGQTIGVCYGGPSEFKFQGMVQDYYQVPYDSGFVEKYYNNDDIYMDLTFVGVIDRLGTDAPVDSFADAFAHAGYALWHANQAGRYNILRGLMPQQSGYWKNNPHADDIDYQIESDFAGLMSPGMPNTASAISDKVGHIMNYGDGWYGGVFVGAMYSLAFVSKDIEFIVAQALKTIPGQSEFHRCLQTVVGCYQADQTDWRKAWFEVEKKWSADRGCPDGVFSGFNIDAKLNAAYIVIGLLYGHGDFGKTIDIAMRCGQDSDCNPSNAAGILGTIIGYDHIPPGFLNPVKAIEDKKQIFTPYSLNEVYQVGLRHALRNIQQNGGNINGDSITISVQIPTPVRFEKSFGGLVPVALNSTQWDNINLDVSSPAYTFPFTGRGIVVRGESLACEGLTMNTVNKVAIVIDGNTADTSIMPVDFHNRKTEIYWNYDLKPGPHTILLKLIHPLPGARVRVGNSIIYE